MKGLLDKLLEETIDPNTGESLGCYATINTDQESEVNDAEKIVFDLKPQTANSDIIISFIDMVESGKLQMLEKKTNADYDIHDKDAYLQKLPFINTDFLVEEVANLKLKQLPSGKYTVEKVIKRFNKDRFSAVEYGLWYIKTYEDNVYEENDETIFDFLII